jgi:calcineurin-like phosphoesterase family protein
VTRYFTADLHLGHARIIELCDRPFSDVDQMNEAILDGINSTIKPYVDDLCILGDLVMGRLENNMKLLSRIMARKLMLIPGNHDRWSLAYHTKGDHVTKRADWQRRYREACSPSSEVLVMTDHVPSKWRLKVTDLSVWASHYPTSGDSHGEDRYDFLRPPVDTPGFLLHGHVHNEWRARGTEFNVGVDVNEFKPVSEEELRTWMDDTTKSTVSTP